MGFIGELIHEAQASPFGASVALGGLSVLFFVWFVVSGRKRGRSGLKPLPEVPGLPVVGNLLQLKDKKPYKTFTRWAETYGPIYSIRAGASTMVVLNSSEVAKEHLKPWEAMVTRYNSISTRKLSNALKILTCDKAMVAISDYNEFHKTVKKYILNNVLGVNAQKKHRCHRETLLNNITREFHSSVKNDPTEAVNFRKVFENELFGLGMKEALGKDVKSVYVEALGATLSKEDIYQILVTDLMAGALEVDWRDFFPYLKWLPNRSVENRINRIYYRRKVVMAALINDQRKRLASGEETNGYVDFLLSEPNLTEEQLIMLLWETIIETSDTTLVTSEWAMYELAKDPERQERLFQDIKRVCGSEKITEDHIPQLPYLSAVFHEILRKHSPAPIVPLRFAHEDTEIGGYFIPAGSEIAINIYGCHMDKKQWSSPEEFKPERFLDGKYDPTDMYKTMAFGAGKRVCAGALQAHLIACTSIGRLVQEFEWRLKEGEEDNVDTVGLTTHKRHPMHAMLKPRN